MEKPLFIGAVYLSFFKIIMSAVSVLQRSKTTEYLTCNHFVYLLPTDLAYNPRFNNLTIYCVDRALA